MTAHAFPRNRPLTASAAMLAAAEQMLQTERWMMTICARYPVPDDILAAASRQVATLEGLVRHADWVDAALPRPMEGPIAARMR